MIEGVDAERTTESVAARSPGSDPRPITGMPGQRPLRVAIVHYWLVKMRGGERLLELLCELYPDADIYTLVYRPEAISETINRHRVTASFIQRLPFGVSHYPAWLPLMPMALEAFDLRGYDLVISSESGPAKGVITQPETCHICYVETPMRYLWSMSEEYAATIGRIKRMLWRPLATWLRLWDYAGAQRVDFFLANSHNVRRRIERYWSRQAEVIHCPVDCTRFVLRTEDGALPSGDTDEHPKALHPSAAPRPRNPATAPLLFVGELTPYKRADLAVQACTASGRRLIVVGEGQDLPALRRMAGPNVEFTGWLSTDELVRYYQECSAFIFPGDEDFGITPLEAMACGKPVVALGKGGALETVVEGRTGVFFHESTPEALNAAIETVLTRAWDPVDVRARALEFDRPRIREQLGRFISERLDEFRGSR